MAKIKIGKSGNPVFYEKLQKQIEKARKARMAKEERAKARKQEQQRRRKNEKAKQKRKEEMQLRKDMERINKELKRWDKFGLTSNDLELYKTTIEQFNDQLGYDTEFFVPNMPFNASLKEEAQKIVNQIKNNNELNVDYFRNLYKEMNADTPTTDNRLRNLRDLKDEFSINSVQDLINFVDRMERYKTAAEIRNILSSDQYEELSSYAASKGMTQDDIDTEILKSYNKSGRTFNDLYNIVYRTLQTMGKKK